MAPLRQRRNHCSGACENLKNDISALLLLQDDIPEFSWGSSYRLWWHGHFSLMAFSVYKGLLGGSMRYPDPPQRKRLFCERRGLQIRYYWGLKSLVHYPQLLPNHLRRIWQVKTGPTQLSDEDSCVRSLEALHHEKWLLGFVCYSACWHVFEMFLTPVTSRRGFLFASRSF